MGDDLTALAEHLTRPGASGVYLTRGEIVVLARLAEGSLRVSERRRMLADVLRSCADVEELGRLLHHLLDFCHVHEAHYRELVEAFPALAGPLAPWRERTGATARRLEELIEELAVARREDRP